MVTQSKPKERNQTIVHDGPKQRHENQLCKNQDRQDTEEE